MVNEAYRVWHGVPFLDDALQAPLHHQHFDGYWMGDTTDTKYKPLDRIPGLNVGGWFDAGDFDIQTGSHCNAVLSLVDTWEKFKPDRDQTYIDYETRYVDIHRPDGKPDILQQIEHGTLNIVAQVKILGIRSGVLLFPTFTNIITWVTLQPKQTISLITLHSNLIKRMENQVVQWMTVGRSQPEIHRLIIIPLRHYRRQAGY